MGNEPALVELTAITSAYGAGDQHFHQDNSHDSCQMGYARSFVSMYSIFIPLQDTTKEMGATDACAGTHYCSSYDQNMCYHDDNNIRVLGTRGNYTEYTADPTSDAKYWKAGDAFLFDMPVIHRGPAHTDPTPGNERVMLVLTVSPRPRDSSKHGFDRRQLGLGTSYSNRWDMWGMTLSDLEDVESAMFWPWRLLRTLGIYKRPTNGRSAVWGFDMLSVTATRLMNKQFGYRMNDLRQFMDMLENHPSKWANNRIVKYLFDHRHLDWLDWVEEALDRSKKTVGAAWISLMMLLVLTIPVRSWKFATSILGRILFLHATIFSLFAAGMLRLQMSPWGADLLSHKSMSSPLVDNSLLRPYDRSIGPTKLPVSRDVLLGNARINSRWMASHNRMADFHPGNIRWLQAMDESFNTFDIFSKEHPVLKNAVLASIANVIWSFEQGDFLKQIDSGDWIVLTGENAVKETRRQLMGRQSGAIKIINEEIAYQTSECRHGPRRDTSMSRFYCMAVLEDLQRRLFRENIETRKSIIPMPRRISSPAVRRWSSSTETLRSSVAKPIPSLNAYKSYKLGNDVVAFTEEGYWREGKITAGPDRYGRYSIRLVGANHGRHGYTEARIRYLSETDRTLIEGTMAEDDEDDGEESPAKLRSLSNYLRLSRCSARFKCEFAGEEGDMDCSELIE